MWVIKVGYDPICVTRMGTHASEFARFDIAGIDQPGDRPLHRRAAATDFLGDHALAQKAPAKLIGMDTEEAQHLKVAPFEARIGNSARRNNGISLVGHCALASCSGS